MVINYRGDKWEQPIRGFIYRAMNDSIPVYSVEHVNDKGVPYVDYKTLNGITPGRQYNPTIVCNYAIGYYKTFRDTDDTASLVKFYRCADWLVHHLSQKDNYALYLFHWQQPWYDSVGIPYTSGMTAGLAHLGYGNGIVDRVVANFEDQVMQAGAIGGVADVHAGTLADGLQAFEDLDAGFAVGRRFRLRDVLFTHCFGST